jgi:hypothetical protein
MQIAHVMREFDPCLLLSSLHIILKQQNSGAACTLYRFKLDFTVRVAVVAAVIVQQ